MIRRTLLKKLILTVTIILWVSTAHAANWYVRPNGGPYGSASGTDWNNAWAGLSSINFSSVSCGDTIWVAGGTYTSALTPAKTCTSGNVLAIRTARTDATQSTGATGWSSSYASTVHQTGGNGINFASTSSYVTISGRTTGSGGSNGWWIDLTGQTAGAGVFFADSQSNTYATIEYMDLQGAGNITYTGTARGIDNTPYNGDSIGACFSHLKIWGWDSGAYQAFSDHATYEYIEMYDIGAANWSSFHPNGIYVNSSNFLTVRYSKFHVGPNGNGVGEGIYCQGGTCDNWQIYGNSFYHLNAAGWKAMNLGVSVNNLKLFNNTYNDVTLVLYHPENCSGASDEFKNNLMFNSGNASCGTTSNNINDSSPNPFVDSTNNDYHIVSTMGTGYPRNTGTNLSAYFTTDMDGTTFGTDGAWDIGAYEFATGGIPISSKPASPVLTTVN